METFERTVIQLQEKLYYVERELSNVKYKLESQEMQLDSRLTFKMFMMLIIGLVFVMLLLVIAIPSHKTDLNTQALSPSQSTTSTSPHVG